MEGTRDFEQESRRESEGMQEGYEVRGDCLASLAKTIGTLLTNRETHEMRERVFESQLYISAFFCFLCALCETYPLLRTLP